MRLILSISVVLKRLFASYGWRATSAIYGALWHRMLMTLDWFLEPIPMATVIAVGIACLFVIIVVTLCLLYAYRSERCCFNRKLILEYVDLLILFTDSGVHWTETAIHSFYSHYVPLSFHQLSIRSSRRWNVAINFTGSIFSVAIISLVCQCTFNHVARLESNPISVNPFFNPLMHPTDLNLHSTETLWLETLVLQDSAQIQSSSKKWILQTRLQVERSSLILSKQLKFNQNRLQLSNSSHTSPSYDFFNNLYLDGIWFDFHYHLAWF